MNGASFLAILAPLQTYRKNMLFSEIGPQTLNRELNSYLEGSKLSLSQIAKKLEVSKGHLSEIKNGKATPALNTGLRILKLCGLEIEQRRAWAHFYNTSISDEYLEVHDDWEKENTRKLNEKVSCLLARDLDLMNAYIDIVNSEEEGLPLVDLRVEYGRSIEGKLQKLCSQEVISIEVTDLGKVYKTGKVDPIITRHASYDLIETVINDQQMQYQAGDYKGKFKFHINDVDQEGHQKLVALLEETMKEAEVIMSDHRQNRKDGGERFAFEILLGRIKMVLVFTFLSMSFLADPTTQAWAQGGGLTGGSSRLGNIEEIRSMNWREIQEINEYAINWPTINFGENQVEINKLCHNKEEKAIKTINPVEICEETQLVREYCEYSGTLIPKCALIKVDEEEEVYERSGNVVSTSVLKRICIQKSEKTMVHKLDWNGFFVNFNGSSQGQNSYHFLRPQNEGRYKVDVEVMLKVHTDYDHSHNMPVGKKPFEIPNCQ